MTVVEDGQVLMLSPEVVAQHPGNLRDASRGIGELAESIAEVGVVVPLIVVPVERVEGFEFPASVTHVAVDGNRRQRAAAAAGALLPCVVRPDVAAARETAMTMAVTALARDGFTVAEEVRATQTMLDLGIDEEAIARATARPAERVRHAAQAAQLQPEIAERAFAEQLDLRDLAVLTEFQHDERATDELIRVASSGLSTDSVVIRLRREREVDALLAAAEEEMAEQGVPVVGDPARRGSKARLLVQLRTAKGGKVTALTHRKCPGHAVFLSAKSWESPPEVLKLWVCTDPAAYGHVDRTGPDPDASEGTPTVIAEDGADPDEAERDRAEVDELLAAWAAAQEARRGFLRLVTQRRKQPAALLEWVVDSLVHRDGLAQYGVDENWYDDDCETVCTILGLKVPEDREPGELLQEAVNEAPKPRWPLVLWAMCVSQYEDQLRRCTIDHVSMADLPVARRDRRLLPYLEHLIGLGHQLSEVEAGYIDVLRARVGAAGDDGVGAGGD